MNCAKDNLLFIASCEVNSNKKTGVAIKIFNQKRVFEKYYNVYLLGFSKNGLIVINGDEEKIIPSKNRRKARVEQAIHLCKTNGIKKCFIRAAALEPYYISLLKALKLSGVDIVMEIPTYPYDGELNDTVKHKIILTIDHMLRPQIKKYVSRIATYSKDKKIHGVKCINLTNGIDVYGRDIKNVPLKKKEIHMVAVANISNWHGYDRLIKGIANYNGKEKVIFDIVGEGEAWHYCKEIANNCCVNDNVIFHGFKSGEELERILDNADLGVDHLGLHRKGLVEISSLKGGEYTAKGLPVLSSAIINSIPTDWPYFISVSANEEPIDIAYVIGRLQEIKKNESYRNNIRKFSEETFEISNTLMPVVQYLEDN